MWIIALPFFCVVSSTTAFEGDIQVLDAPSKVAVGHESDTEVLLAWEWKKPPNLSLRRVEFVLIVESTKHSTRIFYPRFTLEPFRYRVMGLAPDTRHTLRIVATSANWEVSPAAELSFTTLAKDWPTPLIRELIAEQHYDAMEYYVRWLIPLKRELTHLEVEICRPKTCEELEVHRTDLNARVRIPYKSKFTLRVAACYNLPVIGQTKRYSMARTNSTGRSPPTSIFKTAKATKIGNRIKLDWHPSLGPKAPNSYYEIFVCDPSSRSKLFGSFIVPDDSNAALRAPGLEGDAFELSPAHRVNTKRGSMVATDPIINDEPDSCEIPQPLLLVVVRRTQSAVRFRIVFRNFQRGGLSESQASERNLLLGPEVAEAFGFSPDAKMHIKIRTCLNNPEHFVDVCGNFTDFEMISNVAAPSAVQNLDWSFPAHDKLRISWDRPETPRGPIDGYRVDLRFSYGNWVTSEEEFLEHNVTSFVLENYNPRKTYEISVAGFNIDREDNTVIHVGSWTSVTPSISWFAHFGWSTTMTSITVLSLSILIICLIADRET